MRVGPDTSYKTISQAIDAAVDGDVISVAAGMYGPPMLLLNGHNWLELVQIFVIWQVI